MRGGLYGRVFEPALAYLKLFDEFDEELPPAQRLDAWLGPRLAQMAMAGFEAFLRIHPPWPSASQIAASAAENRNWNAASIIVAALAERHRTGTGFLAVPDERLLAGLYELWRSRIDDHAGIEGLLDTIEAEIRRRGLWETALRGYLEPQLSRARDHLDGIYLLSRDTGDRALMCLIPAEFHRGMTTHGTLRSTCTR